MLLPMYVCRVCVGVHLLLLLQSVCLSTAATAAFNVCVPCVCRVCAVCVPVCVPMYTCYCCYCVRTHCATAAANERVPTVGRCVLVAAEIVCELASAAFRNVASASGFRKVCTWVSKVAQFCWNGQF
jgi:hypothetical protein